MIDDSRMMLPSSAPQQERSCGVIQISAKNPESILDRYFSEARVTSDWLWPVSWTGHLLAAGGY